MGNTNYMTATVRRALLSVCHMLKTMDTLPLHGLQSGGLQRVCGREAFRESVSQPFQQAILSMQAQDSGSNTQSKSSIQTSFPLTDYTLEASLVELDF